MRPLVGFIIDVTKTHVKVKLKTKNVLTIKLNKKCKGKFKYGQEVRIGYDFIQGKVQSISLASEPYEGTQKCQRCSQTSINLGDDSIEDII